MFATTPIPVEYLGFTKAGVTVGLLALLWTWETWLPFFERRDGRLRHAGRNLVVAILNTVVLGVAFGTVVSFVAAWSVERRFGLLHAFDMSTPARFILAVIRPACSMLKFPRAHSSSYAPHSLL